ncbi:MAG: aminoglycoside phosphotransferase family protein [Actinomycetota bacterium]|nr:kinase [Acidothermales bacterium]MDQ3432406.1 aminoglycoside phosphotransferase family protein [Actinomycetota bacterium]
MPGFELPRNLVRAVAEDDDTLSTRRTWMLALPIVVDDLARRWSLRLGSPFQPGGVASWVAPAHTASGQHLVLKVAWRHDEALHEADGLRAWDGDGTVQLLDALVIDETSALLLETCEPGTALATMLPPPERDEVVAGLLRRLWIQPPAGHPFRQLQSMCDWWADEFEAKYAAAAARASRLDPGLAGAGIELFRGLPRTAEHSVLLGTDVHPENVLAAQRERWLVIDPKPYVGDPTYDPLQHMLNFPARLASDPAGFVQRMADLLDLDRDRLRQWLFARCVQESLDQPHLQQVAVDLAP